MDALTTLYLWLQIASFIIYACYDLTIFFFASNKQNTDIIYTITYHYNYISYFVLIIFEYLLLR